MNRKKATLILVASILALVSAGIMIGAISFNPMPTLFNEFWSGSIENTSYTLDTWRIDIIDPDGLRVYLNGTADVSDDYKFMISILDSSGFEVVNATRTISLTSGIPSEEMFTFSHSGVVSSFTYIDIEITR